MALTAALPAWAALPREWSTAQPIVLPELSAPRFVYLPLDEAALTVKELSEYRIAGPDRAETPYRMVLEEGQTEAKTLPARLLAQTSRSKNEARIELDLGDGASYANRVELTLAGNNFRCIAFAEASADRKTWWELAGDEIVYRYEGKFVKTWVAVPPHEGRFLRITLTLLQGKMPKLTGAQVVYRLPIPRRLIALPAEMTRRDDTRTKRTLLGFDLGGPIRDIVAAKFVIGAESYDRPVTVEASADGKDYELVSGATLRRVAGKGGDSLEFYVSSARYLRIGLDNGDDRPFDTIKASLWRTRRGLMFYAYPEKKYELWYGRANTPTPDYDIQRLPLIIPPAKLPQASLGPAYRQAVNPPPPPPWSERHRAVFWVILVVVLALLGLLVVRTMRSVKTGDRAT